MTISDLKEKYQSFYNTYNNFSNEETMPEMKSYYRGVIFILTGILMDLDKLQN